MDSTPIVETTHGASAMDVTDDTQSVSSSASAPRSAQSGDEASSTASKAKKARKDKDTPSPGSPVTEDVTSSASKRLKFTAIMPETARDHMKLVRDVTVKNLPELPETSTQPLDVKRHLLQVQRLVRASGVGYAGPNMEAFAFLHNALRSVSKHELLSKWIYGLTQRHVESGITLRDSDDALARCMGCYGGAAVMDEISVRLRRCKQGSRPLSAFVNEYLELVAQCPETDPEEERVKLFIAGLADPRLKERLTLDTTLGVVLTVKRGEVTEVHDPRTIKGLANLALILAPALALLDPKNAEPSIVQPSANAPTVVPAKPVQPASPIVTPTASKVVYCALHKNGTHSTEQCTEIARLADERQQAGRNRIPKKPFNRGSSYSTGSKPSETKKPVFVQKPAKPTSRDGTSSAE